MSEIILQGQSVIYSIERSKRRSISLHIESAGTLLIKAPYLLPEFLIQRFVRQKENWIVKKITQKKDSKTAFTIVWNESTKISYMGNPHEVTITTSDAIKEPRLYFLNNTFQAIIPPSLSPAKRQQKLTKLFNTWVLKNCKQKVEERVAFFAKQLNASYKAIRIRDVTTLWGSCSSNKNLTFNFRLALLPSNMLDYVIIHELCHLREMNHSHRFWKLVEQAMPNYKEIRKEMKELSIPVE